MLQHPPSDSPASRASKSDRHASSRSGGLRSILGPCRQCAGFIYAYLIARYLDGVRVLVRRPLILFFRNGGIGDILCTFPAAAEITLSHPEAYTIYCTHPDFVSLAKSVNCFNQVLGIKMSDLVVSLLSRRHQVHRFNYPDERPAHVSTSYLADEFSTANGLQANRPWPNLNLGKLSPRVAAAFRGSTAPVICIHTGPTWKVREWPLSHWDALVAELVARKFRVLQIGASRHFIEGTRSERAIEGAEDFRDRFSLLESLQVVSEASAVVAIDSGLVHGAVALGVPVIGLFGATSAGLRLPGRFNVSFVSAEVPCRGCHHRLPRLHWRAGCPHEIRCMTDLTPEAVLKETLRVLSAGQISRD